MDMSFNRREFLKTTAAAAAFLHGRAADAAGIGMVAEDLLAALPRVLM